MATNVPLQVLARKNRSDFVCAMPIGGTPHDPDAPAVFAVLSLTAPAVETTAPDLLRRSSSLRPCQNPLLAEAHDVRWCCGTRRFVCHGGLVELPPDSRAAVVPAPVGGSQGS